MADTLAPRAVIGVMTPAMNTVVQPELELLRPDGVTNQMQRFRLGGDNISDDLSDEAAKLMDCGPRALAIGLTTDAGPRRARETGRARRGVGRGDGHPGLQCLLRRLCGSERTWRSQDRRGHALRARN